MVYHNELSLEVSIGHIQKAAQGVGRIPEVERDVHNNDDPIAGQIKFRQLTPEPVVASFRRYDRRDVNAQPNKPVSRLFCSQMTVGVGVPEYDCRANGCRCD